MANLNNYYNLPPILRDYLINLQTVQGKSPRTVHEYYLDLRNFFRFIFQYKNLCPPNQKFNTISLDLLNLELIREITLNDVYAYLNFLAQERPVQPNSSHSAVGLSAKSRARKVSALRTYFKYLTDKVHLLDVNPITQLDLPKYKKDAVPKYLSVDSAEDLLDHVDGTFKERDYCILVFFLNCGLRVSELVGLNLDDIRDNYIRVLGKGNKERILYLNDACVEALNAYLPKRFSPCAADAKALFVSRNSRRINVQTVKWLVKKHLKAAGLSDKGYSAHKLRHTAATLMYQNGVDIRTLQEVLGHDNVNTTMIYTHTADENLKKALSQNPLANLKRKSEE
jgi:site-specific recombinase XerD